MALAQEPLGLLFAQVLAVVAAPSTTASTTRQHGAVAPERLDDAVGFSAHEGLQGWGVIAMSVIWPCLGP